MSSPSWRTAQLGTDLCDQDQLIKQLIGSYKVRLHGEHCGFYQFCEIDPASDFCLIFLNKPMWLSEIKKRCASFLSYPTNRVYIGINRYQIKGNDTSYRSSTLDVAYGPQLLGWLSECLKELGFTPQQQGHYDYDRGRHFNFVQPLTWIYAEHETVQDHRTK